MRSSFGGFDPFDPFDRQMAGLEVVFDRPVAGLRYWRVRADAPTTDRTVEPVGLYSHQGRKTVATHRNTAVRIRLLSGGL